jgi:hypothetical protein
MKKKLYKAALRCLRRPRHKNIAHIRNLNLCLREPQMEFQTPMIYYRVDAGTSSLRALLRNCRTLLTLAKVVESHRWIEARFMRVMIKDCHQIRDYRTIPVGAVKACR